MTPRMAAETYVTRDYEARARRGLRPCFCAAVSVDAGAAAAAGREFLPFQNVTIAAATKTLEYVPVMIPTIIVKENPRSTSPPNRYSAIADRRVKPAVSTVRPSVWLIARSVSYTHLRAHETPEHLV